MIFLFKSSSQTLPIVIEHMKHALTGVPRNIRQGDLILLSQNGVNRRKGEKSIRWVMEYVSIYEDTQDESIAIWGKKWRYIVQARNARQVEPFNIQDLQFTNFNYDVSQKPTLLRPEDEAEVLRYLGQTPLLEDDQNDGVEDFSLSPSLKHNELIEKLDQKYGGSPKYKHVITRRLSRPTPLRDAILARDGTSCRLCGFKGFKKKSGGYYAEVHHMIELNTRAPNTLQSWNVIVVCPTCHRKLHHADVRTNFLNPGWQIEIDDQIYTIKAE
jgi:5-methylcytosine-specific restriction protein A